MRSYFTNQFQTSSTVARAIEAMVVIAASMLGSLFVFSAVLPPAGFTLIA